MIWIDDEHGAELAARYAGQVAITTVGTGPEADYRLTDFSPVLPLGGRANLARRGQVFDLEIALPGHHNMIDAAVAVAMLEVLRIPIEPALAGLARAQVPGRMQVIDLDETAPLTIVDFAHTPQAVAATLDALQGFERIVTVVGCGGDRDPDKRQLMGQAAAERSDLVVITDDNPRTEQPAAIRAAIVAGARAAAPGSAREAVLQEVDGRSAAIAAALRQAGRGSVVAILGKGHETGQEVNGVITPFDDAVEARRAWAALKEDGGA